MLEKVVPGDEMLHGSQLRKRSAEIGYNIAFGAKKHFSTNTIVDKFPSYFGVVTVGMGIFFLKYPQNLLSDALSIITITIGFGVTYLNFYSTDKDKYIEIGKKLNVQYAEVRSIYEKASSTDQSLLQSLEKELEIINKEFQAQSIHKQVFGSSLFAHYKLFGESFAQSEWFVQELKLSFFKDMIPASVKIVAAFVLIVLIAWLINLNLVWPSFAACMQGK